MRPLGNLLAIACLLIGSTPPLLAQDEGDTDYPRGTILLGERSEWRFDWTPGSIMPHYQKVRIFSVIGGPQDEKLDFFGTNLRYYLEGSPAAMEEFGKFTAKRTGQVVSYVGIGLGLVVVLAGVKDGGEVYDPFNDRVVTKRELTTVSYVGFGIMLTGLVSSIVFSTTAKAHIPKAVALHNAELTGETAAAPRPTLRLTPHLQPGNTGLTLALRW